MKRNQLLTLLKEYSSPYSEELLYKEQIIAFIKDHEDCFERSLSAGHITASCWLLNPTKTKALLMHHAKLNLWVQCGGHCDGESDALTVCLKEAQEESGLKHIVPISRKIFDIDVHKIPENAKDKAHYHYDIRFLLQSTKEEPLIMNSESKALLWVGLDPKNLPTQERSILRMHEKWQALT